MSAPINDGGPAFPLVGECHEHVLSVGMTLRDYFAAKAIMGSMASCWTDEKDMPEVARRAYVLADAMLKARDQ